MPQPPTAALPLRCMKPAVQAKQPAGHQLGEFQSWDKLAGKRACLTVAGQLSCRTELMGAMVF